MSENVRGVVLHGENYKDAADESWKEMMDTVDKAEPCIDCLLFALVFSFHSLYKKVSSLTLVLYLHHA